MSPANASVRFETLLAHREWARRLALSLVHDDASADDIVQGALIAALRGPPRDTDRVQPWLARVVRRKALDFFRARGRRDVHERAAVRDEAVRSTADVVADAESQKRIVVAVCGLAEPYRTTMLLRFFEDLAPRDVAARMDVPVETVRTRLRRAANLVRAELGGDGSDWIGAISPLLAVPRGGATEWAAGGIAVKVSTKTVVVAALLLLSVGAVTMMVVARAPGDGNTPTDATPDARTAASAGGAADRPSRARRARDADPAIPDETSTDSETAASARDRAPSASSIDAAFEANAVTVTSTPRPSGRTAATPLPWSTADFWKLVEAPAEPPIPQNELADDASAFARGFVRRRDGATIDPLTTDFAQPIADGTRILFPAGCHRWNPGVLGRVEHEFPQDLVIEGAGMNDTLVVLAAHLVGYRARVLTFRNLTIHCNDYILAGLVLSIVRFDHVRVIGFDGGDMRQGAGQVIGGQATAVLAEDCRFESGFGSTPGRMMWFLGTSPATTPRSGWITIARFERCRFVGPFEKPSFVEPGFSVFVSSPPAATVFSRCDLVDATPVDRALIEHPDKTPPAWTTPTYVRFEDCRVTYAPTADATPRRRREVSELNSAWRMPETPAPK